MSSTTNPLEPSSASAPGRDSASRHRVLVADDDSDFRQLLGSVLRNAGYDVTEVASGAELIERLCLDDRDSEWKPAFDVVITDVRMPGVTGLSAAQGLSALHYIHRVILISAFADEALRAEARRIGATRVLAKPFTMDALITEVRNVLAHEPAARAPLELAP